MIDGRRTDGLSAAWIALGCALAFSIDYSLTERIRLGFQPGYFLPLLVAWLAGRAAGARAVVYMLLFGIFAAFYIGLGTGALHVSFGFSGEVYLVSILAAYAFASPRTGRSSIEWLLPWWRWSLWAMLCVLALAGLLHLSWDFKIGTFESRWEVGVVFGILMTLVSVNWSDLAIRLRPVLPPLFEQPIRAAALIACACMLVVALFVDLRFHTMDVLRVEFGMASSWYWLTVACFAATAWGILDWRALIAVLMVLFAAEWACTTYWIPLEYQTFIPAGKDGGKIAASWLHSATPQIPLLLSAVSAALFGHAIEPFWSRGDVNALHNRRTLWLMAVILAIQFIILPLASLGWSVSSEPLLLAGITFLSGVLWGRKALFAAPLIIILCFLIGTFAYVEPAWRLPSSIGQFGMVAFPFVFFGILTRERARAPGTTEFRLRTLDVTPLAKLVRKLDVSATLKAFAAVLAPLVVLDNYRRIFAFVEAFTAMDLDFLESGEFLLYAAILVCIILGAFAPLVFIVTDWLARQEVGRYLSAISGAALGLVGIVAIAQVIGASTFLLGEMEPGGGRWIFTGFIALVLSLITIRMLTDSERLRMGLLSALILIGVTVLGGMLYMMDVDLRDPEDLQELLSTVMGIALVSMALWFIFRGVGLRLTLSGTRPRSLLFGELRGGFWVRMAFLVGLPSSMWRRSAMRKPSFWLFISARPLVYVGAVLLGVKASLFGPFVTLGLGSVLIVAGHLAFVGAKHLASREVWKPESKTDERAPILFLRSFDDDQFDFKRPVWDLWGRWFDLWSFRSNADEALIDEVAQYGPVVALGRPGETKAPFGALRHYATSEEWQSLVTDTARRAQAIMMVAGDSQGVLWEYDLLKREGLIDRTLLLFRPGSNETDANLRALEAFARVQRVAENALDGGHMVALLQRESGPVMLVAQHHMAGAFIAAMRAHFQDCPVQSLSDPARLFIEDGVKD